MKSLTRKSVREWLLIQDIDYVMSDNIANACSELIENCIKYSIENEESYEIIKIQKHRVIVETFNISEQEQN